MFAKKNPLYILYWLIIAIFSFLFIFLLVKLFPLYGVILSFMWRLFAPFIIACLIAYLLYPLINKIHTYNIHKGIAVLSVYILLFGGIIYLIYSGYPVIVHQLRDLNEHLPQFIRMYEDIIYNMYKSTAALPEAVHDQMDRFITRMETTLENIVGKLMGGFTRIFDIIVLLTVIPVLVFYFLKDYGQMKDYVKRFVPSKHQAEVSKLLHVVNESLGNYIRGQLLVCLFVSLATLIVFHLLGMKYALLLAVIMGLTNIIPYFGPIIGAIPAVMIALTVSTKLVIFVIISVFVIQLIENNFLSPYIVGKSINIHPVAIIFALLLGGQLSGIIGMIFAVPILTIMKEVTTHLFAFRRDN